MKVMKTVVVPPKPEETKEVVSHALCDLCGARGELEYDGEVEWDDPNDDDAKTTVMLKTGYGYPEGGHWDQVIFHVCPGCFRGKLMPWLEEHGAKPTNGEIDW